MTEDFMRNSTFERADAANPDIIAKLFNSVEWVVSDNSMTCPPMLLPSALKHKIDRYCPENKKQILETIRETIEDFIQWATKQANGDEELLEEINNYEKGLYEWLKQGAEKGKLNGFEQQKLITQRANLTDKLFKIAGDRADLPNGKPAEAEQNAVPVKSRRIWTCVKKIPTWIYIFVIFLAALLTVLHYLGWL